MCLKYLIKLCSFAVRERFWYKEPFKFNETEFLIKFNLRPVFTLLLLLLLTGCQTESQPKSQLEAIKERGVLRVGTLNNQLSYFISPDGPSGLDYDLAKHFAEQLGVELEIKPAYHLSGLFPALNNDEVDILAAGLNHTPDRLEHYLAGPAYYYVSQQVVYKKGTLRPRNIKQLIDYQKSDPQKSSFTVVKGGHFEQTMTELAQQHRELVFDTNITADTGELLKQVSEGTLNFTLADSITLSLSQRLHPNLAVAFELTEDRPISWFIRKSDNNNDDLYALMIEYFGDLSQSGELARLEEKYFGHIKSFDYVDTRAFIRALDSKLPRYKELFQQYSEEFDWRLIAALSYQESHWNPNATSPTGVRGMMMLTLPTAKMVKVHNRLDPEQSIRGGVEYLRGIVKRIPDSIPEHEKIWFALASYNVGYGHVMDARRITKYQKADPDSWTDVKERLPKLKLPSYYRYTRYGYARGDEAKNYVENIRRYYQTIIGYEQENAPDEEDNNGTEIDNFTVIEAVSQAESVISAAQDSEVDEERIDNP